MRHPRKGEASPSGRDAANGRIVLDSNEYIFAFGQKREVACEAVVRWLIAVAAEGRASLFVSRTVVNDVRRHMPGVLFKECHIFWRNVGTSIDEDGLIPSEILVAYLGRGLKMGDALVGAYAEWVDADFLISENRDFLALSTPLPFRVVKAAAFLREFAV